VRDRLSNDPVFRSGCCGVARGGKPIRNRFRGPACRSVEFLRGEISAAETHKQAIENIDDEHAAEPRCATKFGELRRIGAANWGQR
jgi:hypothetical protein